jgi:hypothetical protein
MRNGYSWKTQKQFFAKGLLLPIFIFTLLLTSCLQSPSSKRASTVASSSTTTTSTNLPTFSDGNNYFQNGSTTYTASFSLNIDFSDTFYFRGKEVDNYIRNINTSTPICLISRYTDSTVLKIIVLALVPRSVYNYTNQSLEYYYSAAPSDETTNKNYCQKTVLTDKLYSLYSTLTPYYKLASLCTTGSCSTTGYTSQAVQLFASSGTAITNIKTSALTFNIKNTTTSTSSGSTCTSNSECTTNGYDCCSGNQCVKDLQLKTGVDQTSSEYKQALQDILNSPSSIYNYPQYYYICSTNTSSSTSSTSTSSSSTTTTTEIAAAKKRLDTLGGLYDCVNKINGEYGVCTKTVSSAVSGVAYSVGADDRSFSTTFTNTDVDSATLYTIEKITYGEVVLFDYTSKTTTQLSSSIYTDTYVTINGQHNDDITTGATVTLNTLPSSATSTELIIKYKVDSSCTYVNSTVAQCDKYYTQGQKNYGSTVAENRAGRPIDHYPASNIFKLPTYASTSKAILVYLDGVKLVEGTDWTVVAGSPNYIKLISTTNSSLKAQDSQIVKVTFFAPIEAMSSKLSALESIKTKCSCTDYTCNLAPVKNTAGSITDYVCIYPDNSTATVPVSQKVYLSSKAVPVRYFDSAGVSQTAITADNLAQEGSAFSYTSDNLATPNNLSNYIGFNEIYGSVSSSTNAAKPPKMVAVTKGNSYDLYVDNGSYYSCAQCGTDYYSQLNKLFPTFQYGSGLTPMQYQTNRIASSSSMIRSDEFSFGRACFVPASMLPWSHYAASDVQSQRLYRMKTQHFMYANGYQRDWYGFDYGAVIGSFDGVKWFAVGTNRRIKATSAKLFLAINAPMADLTVESTYTISINDATLNITGAGMVSTDLANDGAECQAYHVCSTDNDCYATLGPDYTCSNVNKITTSWPVFDDNGNEVPDTTAVNNSFINILGLSNPGKRCVYRGKGSLCTPSTSVVANYDSSSSTFNHAADVDFHACTSNNYCQTFSTSGTLNAKFNNRVNRYGKVVSDSTRDSFGDGTPIAMRPFYYNGQETIRSETLHNLSANKAIAMCIPGKNPEATTYEEQNKSVPSSTYFPGDRVVGIGQAKTLASSKDTLMTSSCGIFDSTGDYFFKTLSPTFDLTKDPSSYSDAYDLISAEGSQVISSNALSKIKGLMELKGLTFSQYVSPSSTLSAMSFQQNTCMRAPGASCYSDLDCAPSAPTTAKTNLLSYSDTTITASSGLNPYEIRFWQEPLVCSQSAAKTVSTWDPKNNKCCREAGNTITIGQATTVSTDSAYKLGYNENKNSFSYVGVPGIDSSLNSWNRYSRNATIYKENRSDATTYPALLAPLADQCTNYLSTTAASNGCLSLDTLTNQHNTFNVMGSKTSCTNSWVRVFGNGTHIWSSSRFQTFNSVAFRCFNWFPNTTGGYTCSGLDDGDSECTVAQTAPSSSKAKGILKFLGKLELTGIPQIAIPTEDTYMGLSEGDLSCRSNPKGMTLPYPGDSAGTTTQYLPPVTIWKNFNSTSLILSAADTNGYITTYKPSTITQMREIYDSSNTLSGYCEILGTCTNNYPQYYSANDLSNFSTGSGLISSSKIFKSDEFVACQPTGTTMSLTSDYNKCCSGFINETTMKCALPDFVDVSIYTNKYVSSEGNTLNINLFDEDGYIKDPSYVAQVACAKSMCASGKVAYGVLISSLKIPGQETSTTKTYRFLQGSTTADDANGLLTLFNKGLKLNNHAYCIPSSTSTGTSTDLTIVTCN